MVGSKPSKRDLQKSATLVRRLHEIAEGHEGGFDDRLRELLELGCELFELEIGTVAKITGDRYEVMATVHPRGIELRAGDILKLAETFCSKTIETDGPTGLEAIGSGELASHPAYQAHEVESYLGTTVRVEGLVYGTLSFSDVNRRKRSFDAIDFDCLQLIATWLGSELALRDLEDELGDVSDELERLATIDALTGTLNRRSILERMGDERNRAAREDRDLGVFLLDLDRFRTINDIHGHQTGDQVLIEAARRVASCLRSYDHLGRFGGEEFLAVLPGASLAQAAEIAERARIAISDDPFAGKHGEIHITASFGVSSTEDPTITNDELLATADKALYLAKQRGRNQVRGAVPGLVPHEAVTG
jgi:diguanylate cyclase (GGDEF)-like protein